MHVNISIWLGDQAAVTPRLYAHLMKIILFGASGMIGQAALKELLTRDEVTEVVSFGRAPLSQTHAKLKDVQRKDLHDWSDAGDMLSNVDAVLWCLGISSGGMSEEAYTRITYTLTIDAAKAIVAKSPQARFVFISGAAADPTEKSSTVWARVKGRTENELQRLGFKSVHCFRPGYIQPMDGIESKTPAYKWLYVFSKPFYPLFKGASKWVTSTRELGRALVNVALRGSEKTILESADFKTVA
jgi:uncharacterized protein YbjT (DUF2867 family)